VSIVGAMSKEMARSGSEPLPRGIELLASAFGGQP